MPLFGPNIAKMKQRGDIKGLIKELQNKNADLRVEATEALKDISDPEAIDALNKTLTNALKYGERDEQVEAITLIQGRAPDDFLSFALPGEPKRKEALKKVSKKLNIETFRDALLEIIKQRKSGASVFYALVALVELGDRSNEVFRELLEFSDTWIKMLDQQMEGTKAIFAWALGKAVHEETLRALSYFRGNSEATGAVVKAYEGKFLSSPGISGERKNAIYALGALGDPFERERLEYLSHHGIESYAATVALELYGKATYDEIKNKVESK